jgi:large subunit ribosomal protein L23
MANAKTPAAPQAPTPPGRKRLRGAGPQLEEYQVILRPLVTEKGTHLSTRHNAYTFEVNPLASKEQIAAAIAEMFNVRVVAVRTQNRLGKTRRFKNRPGKLRNWKKAIVKLHPDDRLEFF